MRLNRTMWIIMIVLLMVALIVGCKKQSEGIEEEGTPFTGPETVKVESGTFKMGNTRDDSEGYKDEKPVHEVELTYDYEIGKYEVTIEEFLKFMNDAGVSSEGGLNGKTIIPRPDPFFKYEDGTFSLKEGIKKKWPINFVTWYGAIEYCNWLSQKEDLPKAYDNDGDLIGSDGVESDDITSIKGYRLPTEAEWEYAARGAENDDGTNQDYKYAGSNELDKVGWYKENHGDQAVHMVGKKEPNEIGIYDMSGNVLEWCHDQDGDYTSGKKVNPIKEYDPDFNRVNRGGNWNAVQSWSRVSFRNSDEPSYSSSGIGFRIVKTLVGD